MTPEQEEAIKNALYKMWCALKRIVKRWIEQFKKAFVTCCLESDINKKRARIYLRTKNRRIKRKQFKLLIRAVFT